MSKQVKPMTKGEVRAHVIKHDKRIKRLILKKLRSVKFPVKIRPETIKLSDKRVDLECKDFEVPTFAVKFVVQCESTRFITDAKVDGNIGIDLTNVKSGDNLMDREIFGEWNFHGSLREDDFRVDWKS